MNNVTVPGAMLNGDVAVTSSPASRPIVNREQSRSPRPQPSPRKPSLPQMNTLVSQTFTVTPASARSTPSASHSPYLSSLQCSPLTFQNPPQVNPVAMPAPLELPEPIVNNQNVANNSTPPQRADGLVRKLSHGTRRMTNSLRRKASSSNQTRRDASKGPVARRRSDSKTMASSSFTSEPDSLIPDVPEGLGLSYPISSADDLGALSDASPSMELRAEVVAPAVPKELVAGCWLTKSTRKKLQDKIFHLDAEGSRVTWRGAMSIKSFYIDDITSIRTGAQAASYWSDLHSKYIDPDRCFTINYAPSESSRDTKSLHLLAGSHADLRLWVDTLEALGKHREELMTEMIGSERQSVLRAHWDSETAKTQSKSDTSSQPGLDLTAISNLCRKLHIHCPRAVIEENFKALDVQKVGRLGFDQFRSFVHRLRERIDIRPIFQQWCAPGDEGISKDRFLEFLEKSQGVNLSSDAVRALWEHQFEVLTKSSPIHTNETPTAPNLDFHAFTSFLQSRDCRIYPVAESTRTFLDRPLNEYFISSSHNTYLTGRQVNGNSSVEAYVTALRRGCRSVEIDCWDGDNDNPRVTHGFTRTTSVHFVDVIRAIDRCAFDSSPYPVILSLEVHCNPLQQARMVQIMLEVFGKDKLLVHPLPEHMFDLPSPEELKYKILVKVKATDAHPHPVNPSDSSSMARKRSTSSPYRRGIPVNSASSLIQPASSLPPTIAMMSPPESIYSPTDRSMTATSASSDDDSDNNSLSPGVSERQTVGMKTSKITHDLAALGTYLQGYSFRSIQDLRFNQYNHIFSVNENTAVELCRSPIGKAMFEDHNLRHMCRVYPRGMRLNSSNFDPNTFWRRGVQMVALNWQTYDTHMQMNQAMFAAGSDQSGYVLKPEYLRKRRAITGGFEHRLKLPRFHINFSVKIISAQQLPLLASMGKTPGIDPFIEVQMFSAEDKAKGIAQGTGGEQMTAPNGYHGIGVPYSRRTKVVRENGYNPQFNDLIELSLDTKYPELVFVRFIVYQAGKNSKQLAVFTAKLDSIQTGYRHIPLYNSNGEELIFSTLFCQISKSRPTLVPASLQDLRDDMPRQRTFRGMLSRGMSGERGRDRGPTSVEEQRRAGQPGLNREIEERKGRAGSNQ